MNVLAIAILTACVIAGCAPTRYDGVYIDPVGYNYLIVCELEEAPNGRGDILFCSLDEERGVW
jgi:hypothetical protein